MEEQMGKSELNMRSNGLRGNVFYGVDVTQHQV